MPAWPGYGRFCSLARGLDLIGERWTLVIIQELLHAPRRYSELRSLLPGIGSNVLAERLRRLETGQVVERVPGAVGEGVRYRLTDRGRRLGPALAELRQWGLDELLPPTGHADTADTVYDMSYAVPTDLPLTETYEWHLDTDVYTLRIEGTRLTVAPGPDPNPALVLRTTRKFMRRWVSGETTWDRGRHDGHVDVTGPDDAWNRMLLATAYPGRPPDLLTRLRADLSGDRGAGAGRGEGPPAQGPRLAAPR